MCTAAANAPFQGQGKIYIYMYVCIYICRSIYTHSVPCPGCPSLGLRLRAGRALTRQARCGRHWRTDLGVPAKRRTSFLCAYRSASPFCACTPRVGALGGQGWGVQASQWDRLGWQRYAGEIHCSAGTVLAGRSQRHGKCGDHFPT